MPILIAIALMGSIVAGSAADYFPMPAKARWDYETTGDGAGLYSQVVMHTPIEILIGGKTVASTFYQVTPGGVYVLGTNPKSFYERPQPVFIFDEKGTKWDFDGPSPYEADKQARMFMKGQSKSIGQRSVAGEKRDCIEVRTETKIGLSEKTATVFTQISIYAKGIGLAEMDETIQFGRTTNKRKVKLIKFTAQKVDGL
jgi:hypothetical protein